MMQNHRARRQAGHPVQLLFGVLFAIVAVAVHLSLTWADRRGWVWYRNAQRPPPHTLGLIEEVYHPAMYHVVDE